MKRKTAEVVEWDGELLPKDLTKLSPEQRQKVVDFQSTWPLARLRKFQEAVQLQIGIAFRAGQMKELASLHVSDDLCMLAIHKREFGG